MLPYFNDDSKLVNYEKFIAEELGLRPDLYEKMSYQEFYKSYIKQQKVESALLRKKKLKTSFSPNGSDLFSPNIDFSSQSEL